MLPVLAVFEVGSEHRHADVEEDVVEVRRHLRDDFFVLQRVEDVLEAVLQGLLRHEALQAELYEVESRVEEAAAVLRVELEGEVRRLLAAAPALGSRVLQDPG